MFRLEALVTSYYEAKGRCVELGLPSVLVEFDGVGQIPERLKKEAMKMLRRRQCNSLHLTVMFRLDNGVECKMRYLAERKRKK